MIDEIRNKKHEFITWWTIVYGKGDWRNDWHTEYKVLRNLRERDRMREKRKIEAKNKPVDPNRCPQCTMLLNPEFEKFHKGCPWYEKMQQEI